jgi:MFS family permease
LLPLVASATLHADARVYGLITACFGAGALVGALISASIGRVSWPILLASAAGFGLGELLLAPQRTVISVVALVIATGICYTIYTSTTNALVQLSAPSYLQGRVAGLYSYIFAGSSPFGALIAGSLAARGGTDLAFLVAGFTALACAAFGVIARPRDGARADHGETLPEAMASTNGRSA